MYYEVSSIGPVLVHKLKSTERNTQIDNEHLELLEQFDMATLECVLCLTEQKINQKDQSAKGWK